MNYRRVNHSWWPPVRPPRSLMRHSRPSTCKSTGKYLILKSGSNENGWGCRKEHSHKRKKHVFFRNGLTLSRGTQILKGRLPHEFPWRSLQLQGVSVRENAWYTAGAWRLDLASEKWWIDIYLIICIWYIWDLVLERTLKYTLKHSGWKKKEICKQAEASVKPQNPAFYWSSQNTVRFLAISIKLSPYIYNIYIQLLVIFMLVALPMGLSETEATEVPATLMVNSHSPWTILVILRYANHNWSNLFKWKYTSYIWFKNLYSLQ